MALFVTKFGGSSLANVNCFFNAVRIVKDLKQQNHDVVVVVSAMAGETNRLRSLALDMDLEASSKAAYDVVVSSGEQAASGLLALALDRKGLSAKAFQGWQIPITTSDIPSKAYVESIDTTSLTKTLKLGHIPVISGFQGLSKAGQITTLGRGGSDVTAVLVAAALKADECRLYKDVEGIASADPRLVDTPVIIDHISLSDLLEQCSQGAKVIHPRAVQAAMQHDVKIRIAPTFAHHTKPGDSKGTVISNAVKRDTTHSPLESRTITGIVCNENEVRFIIPKIQTGTGTMRHIFENLAAKAIAVDMVLYDDDSLLASASPSNSMAQVSFTKEFTQDLTQESSRKTLSFTTQKTDAHQTNQILKSILPFDIYQNIVSQDRIAKIAVIGSGMKDHAIILARVYETLNKLGVNTYGLTASELKINILVSEDYAHDCVKALHTVFFETNDHNYKIESNA